MLVELAPREAHHAQAGDLRDGVAAAVGLEGQGGEVGGGAVGLGDEAVVGPEEVDLEPRCRGVHARPRQAELRDEGEEADLQLAAGRVGAGGGQGLDGVAQAAGAGARAGAAEESGPQAPSLREARVADGVDAAVQAQQPLAPDPPRDRSAIEAAGGQLRPGHHAVLPRGERRHRNVRVRVMTVVHFLTHAGEDASAARRRGRL